MRLRINAADKDATIGQDKAIANTYGNKFVIPLDSEMLDSTSAYYQAGLGNRLVMKLCSTITTELLNPWYHHQRMQMLV